MTRQEQLKLFCECVYESTDIVEIRQLPSGKRFWITAGELPNQFDSLATENTAGENIYAGINPRKAIGGSKSSDVALARCLFIDFDDASFEDVKWAIEGGNLPVPTIQVNSGHGQHAYWRLTEPIADLSYWTAIQKTIIAAVGSDPAVHDPARIMRLPGFFNVKSEPVGCSIEPS